MGILAWIVLGLIAGLIARAIMPGAQPGGLLITILLGIGGALVGGLVGQAIVGRGVDVFSFWSIFLSVIGAILLLVLYNMATRHRTVT